VKVVWTETALGHLAAIHHYIAQNSAVYAERQIQRLLSRVPQIAEFPDSGRIVPEAVVHARRSGPGPIEP
jgi:plasmid stabilization system protein ParE